jgi:hypothetical protein
VIEDPTAVVARRARGRCEYCLARQDVAGYTLHLEHVVPSARGGTNAASNRTLACSPCNVEAGALTEALFAIDLGAIAEGDPNQPAVYRRADAFFRATYLTADLRRLLEEVLAALAGRTGYDRVVKLRTPFGGGKSHTLAALLHAARDRAALSALPEEAGKGW